MEDILVVVFDTAQRAYEGLNYLNQLDSDGVIDLYAGSVIEKEADGKVSEQGRQGNFAFHTIAGTALGSLTGLLGGPAGFGIGATVGGLTGIICDLHAAGVNSHFVDEVAAILKPGKFAVVADVNEDRTAPVDTRMEALGGIVFRTEKQNFEYELRAQKITEIRGRIDQLKGEEEKAMVDQKSKLQAQIDTLSQKLKTAEAEAEQQAQQLKQDTEAKVQVLQKKAAKAQGDAKAKINAQIDELRKKADTSVAKLKSAMSESSKETGVKQQKAG
jgi:uncharacterized membrane protein